VASDLLGLAIPATVAVVGFGVKYWNDLAIARRRDQLERTNQQLRLVYGPLYAIDRAQTEAWLAFRSLHRPRKKSYWKSEPPPTEADAVAWRLWMTEVFMPMNLRMEGIIVENADLFEEETMADCLLALCAHVAAYKAVLKQWERGDYSTHVSVIDFPQQQLAEYVESRFARLKRRQMKLLHRLGKDSSQTSSSDFTPAHESVMLPNSSPPAT